jgi:multicomponent Na+:H+ antiporter subunit B
MKGHVVLRVVTKLTVPFILVFGFYVVGHGELGPGGGFQGGIVLASAFILYGLVYGIDEMRRVVPRAVSDAVACLGVALYAGVGVFGMAMGRPLLDYRPLAPGSPASAETWGMTLTEYGVALTVCAVMITIFNQFTEE